MGELLQGQVAIVTGGGWNIGRAVAERFAAEGARVVVTGRRAEPLEETVAAITAAGGEALAHPADVTVAAEMESVVAHTLESFGAVHVLVALAGGGATGLEVDACPTEAWEGVIRANVFSTFHAVHATLPHMRAANTGRIITCSGGGAWFPALETPATAYASAKAAVCRFTDQLAVELAGTDIRVNCLQPLPTHGPEPHDPSESAELAAFLASESSAPLSGRTVSAGEDWWRDPERIRAVSESHHAACLRRQEAL